MPYKYTGDYAYKKLGYMAGDPGLFSFIGKALGSIGKSVSGALPGPVGAIARKAVGVVGRFARRRPGTAIAIGAAGTAAAGLGVESILGGGGGRRRRRMNVLNVRAMRRATRRLLGAKKTFGKAMRGIGYTVVRSGSAGRGARHKRGCRCAICR